ncbi:MAG: hypothetical protein RL026_102 [Pseudomonadota bacterium]
MSSLEAVKQHKSEIIRRFGKPEDARAWWETATTLLPMALAFWGAVVCLERSVWLALPFIPLLGLLTMRVLVLLHECGHGNFFRSQRLNRAIGFLFGVISGMPQYVWSQNHNIHHATNGNWEKFRGPLTSPSTDEYRAMGERGQRLYRRLRHPAMAPLAGFLYLLFNPRFTWIKGSLALLGHLWRSRGTAGGASLKSRAMAWKSRYWKTWREFQHMSWNNLVVLPLWALMIATLGWDVFFIVYVASVSLAGGAGIALFTVQHNFEHAYAADTAHWDYDAGAIHGTSFMLFPGWLNWFTADIAYHHVHHLSTRIPSYRLAECHRAYENLFTEVPRVRLRQVPASLRCLLWDRQAQRMISFAEFDAQQRGPATA